MYSCNGISNLFDTFDNGTDPWYESWWERMMTTGHKLFFLIRANDSIDFDSRGYYSGLDVSLGLLAAAGYLQRYLTGYKKHLKEFIIIINYYFLIFLEDE